MYFKGDYEPESFKFEFEREIMKHEKDKTNDMFIDLDYENLQDYFKACEGFREKNKSFTYKEKEKQDLNKYYIKINIDKDEEDI